MSDISKFLLSLSDLGRDVSAKDLLRFSSLTDEEYADFQTAWSRLPVLRRIQLISLLGEMGDEYKELDFTQVLDFAIDDDDPAVRQSAILGLWECDDRKLISKLIFRLREDGDEGVRATAAIALGRFAILYSHDKILEKDGSKVFVALLDALSDEDEPLSVRRRAIESIGAYGGREVNEWINWAYNSAEMPVRESAIFSMGRTCDPDWLPIILQEMDNEEPSIRYEAANASREIADESALPGLRMLIDDPDFEVYTVAMNAVAAIGGPQARQLLQHARATAENQEKTTTAEEALEIMDGLNPDMMPGSL